MSRSSIGSTSAKGPSAAGGDLTSTASSLRERMRPRSPHMRFYRDWPDPGEPDTTGGAHQQMGVPEEDFAPAQDAGERRFSQPSTRAGTPSTTYSADLAGSTHSSTMPPRRARTGTNKLQAREDRPHVASGSRWGRITVDSAELEDVDQLSSSANTSYSESTPQRKRRSTGLLAPSPTLWHSDLRVWAKLPEAQLQQQSESSTPEKKPGGLAKKRLLAKRDSAQLLSTSVSASTLSTLSTAPSGSSSSSAPSSLVNSFSYGPCGPRSTSWTWRKASASLSSSGLLVIETTDDKVPIHSIPTTLLSRTDFRLVDPSLFGVSHAVAIRITATRPAKLDTPLRSPSTSNIPAAARQPTTSSSIPFLSSFTRSSSSDAAASHLPTAASISARTETIETSDWVYLCLGSKVSQHALYALLKTFGQSPPESSAIAPYESSDVLRVSLQPPSRATTSNGDPSPSLSQHQPIRKTRTWRAVDLTIVEGRNVGDLKNREGKNSTATSTPSSEAQSRHPFSPTSSVPQAPSYHASSGGPGSSSRDVGTSSQGSASAGKSKSGLDEEPQHGTMATSGKFFVEVVLNDTVVGKTSVRKGSQSPFWRDSFSFQDLPPFEKDLQLRIYILIMRKGAKHVGCLGVASVPLQTFNRSEMIETWLPIMSPEAVSNPHVGDIMVQIKVTEAVILPSSQYQPLNDLLSDLSDHDILYDIANNVNDLEAAADLVLRTSLEQRTLQARLKQMIELEIDGDESTANILFRGNTLLTKMIELYLRLVGSDFLFSALGDIVTALCKDDIEIEIDPSRLKARHRSLPENVAELNRWATSLWNSLYQARHKCPKFVPLASYTCCDARDTLLKEGNRTHNSDLRVIFQHVQTIVEERYDNSVPTRRFTCISAFVFLRFFVPALLNPRLFGLTSHHPSPQTQRTLTLLAKTLQGLANMSVFKNKEAFMSVMNPFVEENTEAFIDFITSIANPMPGVDGPLRSDWSSLEQDKYQVAIRQRNAIANELARDSVPTLPFLHDLPKDLSLLISLNRKCAQQNQSKQTTLELQQQHQSRFSSEQWPRFLDYCKQLHRTAQSQPRPTQLNGNMFLPQILAFDRSSPSEQTQHTAAPGASWRKGNLPGGSLSSTAESAEYSSVRPDLLSVGSAGSSRFPFRIPSPIRSRHRAQTVSSTNARSSSLKRQGSSELHDIAAAYSDVTLDNVEDERPMSATVGGYFDRISMFPSKTAGQNGDSSSLASDGGSSGPRSSHSIYSHPGEAKPGRIARMLSRN